MAIELYRLVEKVAHMDISLLAGEAGVHHLVSWVHMIETTEASDFLEGGEIAFTTGLGIGTKMNLLDLVKSIHAKDAAGMIVNTGPFIENIPEEVIAYCEQEGFPLFVVPWKVYLAEIMRIFCFTITKEDQRKHETAAAFKNAIFFPKQEELYVVPLSQRGFHAHWHYAACAVKLHTPQKRTARIEALTLALDHYLHHHYRYFALFSYDKEILAIVANYTEERLHDFVLDLQSQAGRLLLPSEELTIGVGKLTKSIRCLYKSYRQATMIERLHSHKKIDSSLIFYSDLGIYKLLLGVEDRDILTEYYGNTIHPLADYDKKNHSDLCEVLRCYLKHNGSVKETADELFVHRNTVNYKLNKAAELLSLDLSTLEARLQLTIGFMLQDML